MEGTSSSTRKCDMPAVWCKIFAMFSDSTKDSKVAKKYRFRPFYTCPCRIFVTRWDRGHDLGGSRRLSPLKIRTASIVCAHVVSRAKIYSKRINILTETPIKFLIPLIVPTDRTNISSRKYGQRKKKTIQSMLRSEYI